MVIVSWTIQRDFPDVRVAVKVYRPLVEFGQPSDAGQRRRAGQVVAAQQRIEISDWAASAPVHCAGLVSAGVRVRAAIRVQTNRIDRRIDNSEGVFFGQESCLRR